MLTIVLMYENYNYVYIICLLTPKHGLLIAWPNMEITYLIFTYLK